MSGGHFDLYASQVGEELYGQWRDEEINELMFDLFGDGWGYHDTPYRMRNSGKRQCEFGPRGGGLFESLDFWLSGDTDEEDYRADVARFKAKWLARRTPKSRVEFYQERFEGYAREIMEAFKEELGAV